MKVPTWILEKSPTAIRRRWQQFLSGIWEPSEWVDTTPLLARPWGPVEGAHLYRFGNANVRWNGRPVMDAGPAELLPVLRRLWQEYPCFFLPRTHLDAWLIRNRADPEVAKLIEEIVAWPEGREWKGTALETLGVVQARPLVMPQS